MARSDGLKKVVVRKYGLMRPLNWDQDCADHLFLMTKFWNQLVEIEHKHCSQYRAIINENDKVAEVNLQIDDIKEQIVAQDILRKEARIEKRVKNGPHTKVFDEKIKGLKGQIKELSPLAKELRQKARELAKEALEKLDPLRKEEVKSAYHNSGLWWSNYNAVLDSYNVARVRAMKGGADLRFHRFDGSGRFRCQIQGGMSVEELINGRKNIAQLRMIDQDDFAQLLGHKKSKQSYGSRNYERSYGVLSITVYTEKDQDGKHRRRMLDFPVILHRPLPVDAILKEIIVTRKRIGTDIKFDVVFTFTEQKETVTHPTPEHVCGVNLGWKAVQGGLRVATLFDGKGRQHLVLPQVIVDKFMYIDGLKGEVDTMTNENFTWLLEKIPEEVPEPLSEAFASLKRAKKPHPGKFARVISLWNREYEDFLPDLLADAESRRLNCYKKEREHHHLRDKVQRRREDFYANHAKKIAETYGNIALDTMNLHHMAVLENAEGEPTELHKKARYHRTVAAVSVFREWLNKQAAKTGTEIGKLSIKSGSTCHACGQSVKSGSTNVRTCLACGKSFDEDENAAINLHKHLVANL